jgi:hypothetical protein
MEQGLTPNSVEQAYIQECKDHGIRLSLASRFVSSQKDTGTSTYAIDNYIISNRLIDVLASIDPTYVLTNETGKKLQVTLMHDHGDISE